MTFWEFFILLFVFIPFTLLLIWTFADIFRRMDISGWVKALWIIGVILFPFLGVLIYWIARPVTEQDILTARAITDQRAAQVRALSDELDRLTRMRESGRITEEEYNAAKARLLGTY